jgi:hypothetical protein
VRAKQSQSEQSEAEGRQTPGPRATGARAAGRRVAQWLYYGAAAFFAVAVTVQVTQQVFFQRSPAEPAPFSSCDQGLRELYEAVERGRQAAEKAEPNEDEEAPLRRYRSAVSSSWRHRDAAVQLCGSHPRDRAILDSIERLRYSEEHGVRHQAAELTALRQRVRNLMAQAPPTPRTAD